jgi:hypothetical protein
MEPYIKLLLWVLSGLVFGSFIYYIILQPAAPQNQNQIISAPPSMQNGSPSVQIAPSQNTTPGLNGTTAQKKEDVRFIVIHAPGCAECVAADDLTNQSITIFNETGKFTAPKIITLDTSSPEAKTLLSQYNITLLPVMIIQGNTSVEPSLVQSWKSSVGSVESDGTLVSRYLPPPYYDTVSGKTAGLVQGIGIAPKDCKSCPNATVYFQSLSGQSIGMAFGSLTMLDENTSQAQDLIRKYNITKLPTILLGPEAALYPVFTQSIKTSGTVADDGWFVLRDVIPPYVDLSTIRSTRGFVDSIHLVNSSCANCVDIAGLSGYIEDSAGLFIVNTTTYETNSTQGSALLKKYNITKIPTLLYSPEVSVYPRFAQAWVKQNNTIESDGWFVFREVDLVGEPYQNVSAG